MVARIYNGLSRWNADERKSFEHADIYITKVSCLIFYEYDLNLLDTGIMGK